jgi:RND family efflux transporter MFP subunit
MSDKRHSSLGIHATHSTSTGLAQRRPALRRGKIAALVILLLLAAGGARTLIARAFDARALERSTAQQARPAVTTVNAKAGAAAPTLQLPGTLQGVVESPIYARSSGYLRRWTHDIGSQVAKGELLAEIDAPEIEQQLAHALAARGQAQANLDLARTSAERWESLRQKDVVSQQELDERRGALAQAQANVAAADSDVRRLQETAAFQRVVAPFSGVVTRRNVDVGDLVDSGNGGAGRALFSLAQVDPLRLYVYVPQAYAALIKTGDAVAVSQAEAPGQVYAGRIARSAGAIDTATRTLQVEISLPNPDGKLLPGAFVQVAFKTAPITALTVPANTLLFRGEGPVIATVNSGGQVKLQPVTIGRNLGTSVEILDGIGSADRLVLNPADSIANGDQVEVAAAP